MACRIAVLISGSGSNLQALIDNLDTHHGDIIAVMSNRPDAYGLERARRAGIDTLVLDHKNFPDRESFDTEMIARLDALQPDLVILAGFMRILSAKFVTHFHGRLLNIHPSLLPKYKGLHTHKRVLEAGDNEHGATVHFVTEELDGGPLVVQARVPVIPGDTPESLAQRVQQQEHVLYPLAMNLFANGRLRLIDGRTCLDGAPLGANGMEPDGFN